MNKTLKYILIVIAVIIGIMVVTMLFTGSDTMWKQGGEASNNVSAGKNSNNKIASTTNTSSTNVGYKDVSAKDLVVMLKKKDFTLVNVHVPYIGDIKGTDVSIPFNTIADNLDKLPKDKTAKIVLYCQSGNMSVTAAKTLSQLGYTNVYNLKGGMDAWKADGNTLIKK